MSGIRKMAVKDLEPGMEIARLGSQLWDHLPHLYTRPGVLESEAQIRRIMAEGFTEAFVVDETQENDGLTPDERLENILLADDDYTPPDKERTPFEQEISEASEAYDKAMVRTRAILEDVKMGNPPDVETAQAIVDNMVGTVSRNRDAMLCLTKISQYDDYTYTHSINVSAIALAFGEFLDMERTGLRRLGLAGLLHDLGKLRVPGEIINKKGALTDDEFAHIKRHPQYGVDILGDTESIPQDVIRAVVEHHEKVNGTGYPQGLQKEEISAFGRILALADVYDALTSKRSYKKAIMPNEAMAIMYGMRDQDFRASEVHLFVKCLGIFPTGSMVELSNGWFALVVGPNAERPIMPTVKVFMDKSLNPVGPFMFDLAEENSGSADFKITKCVNPANYEVNLAELAAR